MKYVLDTNTLSFLMKGDAVVSAQLVSKPRTDIFVPQPVLSEIHYGLARLPSSARKKRLGGRFQIFLNEFSRAEWTDAVSLAFGQTKAALERSGDPLEDFDVAIAAHAIAVQGTVVTDNVRQMKRIRGLTIENWRSAARP